MPVDKLPKLGVDGRILEGIVTSRNADGSVNISPMGPIVDADLTTLVLRPFKSSSTYANLKQTRQGVFHVTDDVELIATTAIGKQADVEFRHDEPLALTNACRWCAFEITSIEDTEDRTTLIAKTTRQESQREFFGFNRAQHAVIEAAILATRLHLVPTAELARDFGRLQVLVNKTGAAAEHRAFEMLKSYVETANIHVERVPS